MEDLSHTGRPLGCVWCACKREMQRGGVCASLQIVRPRAGLCASLSLNHVLRLVGVKQGSLPGRDKDVFSQARLRQILISSICDNV